MAQEMNDELYGQSVFEDGGSLVVDLSGVEEMKYELIPKGIQDAIVDQVEYKISNSSQKPMLEFVFAIDGGEFDKRKLFFYASFSPKALAGTKTNLLRLDPEIFSGAFKPKELAESGVLLGKRCRIKVTHEDYNGEPRSKIQSLIAPNGGTDGGDGFFGG